VPIDFEAAFVRTFIENAALPQPDDAATVGRLASGIGQEQNFLKLGAMEPAELSQLRAELSSTGWNLVFPWCVNILATSNVQDVDGAVRIAEMIYTDPEAREALLPPPPPPAPVAPQPVPPSIDVRETRSLADAISTIAGKIVREIARPFKTLRWG
jgi:hypothetical protein